MSSAEPWTPEQVERALAVLVAWREGGPRKVTELRALVERMLDAAHCATVGSSGGVGDASDTAQEDENHG